MKLGFDSRKVIAWVIIPRGSRHSKNVLKVVPEKSLSVTSSGPGGLRGEVTKIWRFLDC
jgi:hypothetical protein